MWPMRRFFAALSVIALLAGGFEFAGDYGEVLEAAGLAQLPDGHAEDDGHAPADHHGGCDICHFGGVHLLGFASVASTLQIQATHTLTPWRAPSHAAVALTRLDRPPIV